VQARARLLLLDLCGNMLRARHEAEMTPKLLAAVRALGLSCGSAAVFGDAARYTPVGAALVNGALAHALDFDDIHATTGLHTGAAVIPAALAAGEMTGARGSDVLAGIVAGYEVTARLGLALPAGAHFARGHHPSATCGALGAAAAAARVLGLTGPGVAEAFGIAISQASGGLQFMANAAWTRSFQLGWAAMAGLSAATLAREGFRGAADAIEGKAGFLALNAPSPDPARLLQGLGENWEVMATAVKPYPSCRWGHACIDAALALRAELGLRAAEVEAVTLGLPRAGMALIGDDLERRRNPASVIEAQFSAPFVVASALARGEVGWDDMADFAAPALRRLMALTECCEDPAVEAAAPRALGGRVTLRARGATFERLVPVPRGEPDNFLDTAELLRKFHGLADTVLGVERATRMAEAALTLHEARSVSGLLRLASPALMARLAGE
jgi:2-methylcitrate dehydratase PrpD